MAEGVYGTVTAVAVQAELCLVGGFWYDLNDLRAPPHNFTPTLTAAEPPPVRAISAAEPNPQPQPAGGAVPTRDCVSACFAAGDPGVSEDGLCLRVERSRVSPALAVSGCAVGEGGVAWLISVAPLSCNSRFVVGLLRQPIATVTDSRNAPDEASLLAQATVDTNPPNFQPGLAVCTAGQLGWQTLTQVNMGDASKESARHLHVQANADGFFTVLLVTPSAEAVQSVLILEAAFDIGKSSENGEEWRLGLWAAPGCEPYSYITFRRCVLHDDGTSHRPLLQVKSSSCR